MRWGCLEGLGLGGRLRVGCQAAELLYSFCTTSLGLGILLPDFLAIKSHIRASKQGEHFVMPSVVFGVAVVTVVHVVLLWGRVCLVSVWTIRASGPLAAGQGSVRCSHQQLWGAGADPPRGCPKWLCCWARWVSSANHSPPFLANTSCCGEG